MSDYYKHLFLEAVRDGEYRKAYRFFEHCRNENINDMRIFDMPLLNVAVERQELELAQFLLRHGADPNKKSKTGEAALHVAARCGYVEFIRPLMSYGAGIDMPQETYLFTPFFTAFNGCMLSNESEEKFQRCFDTMREFIRYGADWRQQINGYTALIIAHSGFNDRLSTYLDGSYELHADHFAAKLVKHNLNIKNVLVLGIQKPKYRPLNMLIFTVREEFSAVIDFVLKHDIKLTMRDFNYPLSDKFTMLEALTVTGQIDLLLDQRLWKNNIGAMEECRRAFEGHVSKEFLCRFNQMAQDIYVGVIRKNKQAPKIQRRPKP